MAHVDERNLGLDSRGLSCSPGGVLIPRAEQDSGTDWNRDGDEQDVVVFVLDEETGAASDTAVAAAVLGASGARLLLAVLERADGRDWNHDGDMDDLAYVHHEFALATNVALDGLLGSFSPMNGDADLLDTVPFVAD